MHRLRRSDRIAVALLDIAQRGIAVGSTVLAGAVVLGTAGQGLPESVSVGRMTTEVGRGWHRWEEDRNRLGQELEAEPSHSSWMWLDCSWEGETQGGR